MLFILSLILVVSGCTGAQVGPGPSGLGLSDEKAIYKFDLPVFIESSGFWTDGFAVLPKTKAVSLVIESQASIDLLTIDTCHRSEAFPAALTAGWLSPKKKLKYVYTPNQVEQGFCTLRIGTYTKSESPTNVVARAFFDFSDPDPKVSLPARNLCSGKDEATLGVSVCQARAGLIQVLSFPVEVKLAKEGLPDRCSLSPPPDQRSWTYRISRDECTYRFMEVSSPHRVHRHSTVGYDKVRLKGI